MADNRCVRIYDLKQKIKYNPDIGTYVIEEDIDEAEIFFIPEDKIIPCNYCSSDYDQELVAEVTRYHSSGEQSWKPIFVKYCPNCGRELS